MSLLNSHLSHNYETRTNDLKIYIKEQAIIVKQIKKCFIKLKRIRCGDKKTEDPNKDIQNYTLTE